VCAAAICARRRRSSVSHIRRRQNRFTSEAEVDGTDGTTEGRQAREDAHTQAESHTPSEYACRSLPTSTKLCAVIQYSKTESGQPNQMPHIPSPVPHGAMSILSARVSKFVQKHVRATLGCDAVVCIKSIGWCIVPSMEGKVKETMRGNEIDRRGAQGHSFAVRARMRGVRMYYPSSPSASSFFCSFISAI
jgi:hypothetical protein